MTKKNKFIEELSKEIPKNKFVEQLENAQVEADHKLMSDHLGEFFDKRDLDKIMDTLRDDYDSALTQAATSAAATSIGAGVTSVDASQYYSNPSYQYTVPQYVPGKYSVGASGGTKMANTIINGSYGSYGMNDSFIPSTEISADDIKVGGRSLTRVLEEIEKRMGILDDPSPEKLKKYAALKKAYEQYKILESLCFENDDEEDKS